MPDPVLIAIAAALAGKSVGNLYDLVRAKFARHPEATATLEAATNAPPDSPQLQALTQVLSDAAATDPDFNDTLRTLWANNKPTVHNEISGDVHGRVIQAGEIHGNITFST